MNGPALHQFSAALGRPQDVAIGYFEINLGAQIDRLNGEAFEVRGDWLYVDPYSTGAARCDLYSRSQSDSTSLGLSAGALFDRPFNGLRIFQPSVLAASQIFYTSPQAGNPVLPIDGPTLRIFYGVGRCPFTPGIESRGAGYITPSTFAGNGSNTLLVTFNVTPGMMIRRAGLVAQIMSGAASTATAQMFFGSVLTSFSGPAPFAPSGIGADAGRIVDSTVAAAGWATPVWTNIVVPRYASLVFLQLDTRTAATFSANSVVLMVG